MLINFDFDGVIADSFDQLLAICTAAQASIAEGRVVIKRDLQTLENLTFEGLADCLEIPPKAVPDFLQAVFGLQQTEQGKVRFFPEMAALLKSLSQSSDIAIITSSSADLVHGYLMEHGVSDSVSSIRGGETGCSKKDSILANIEQFSVRPKETCMVGDAISDIRQGKAAGVMTIAVSWGFHDRELLLRETPDYLADSPEELLQLLQCFVEGT